MSLHIRIWKEDDLDALVRLNLQWGYETTAKIIAGNMKRMEELPNCKVFIAEINLVVVGFIYVRENIFIGGSPFAEIHGLVVDENFRNMGIGRALIAHVMSWCLENGFSILKLRTNKKRVEANLFYPKLGFEIVKEQNVYEIKLG